MAKVISVTVVGKPRTLTLAERVVIARDTKRGATEYIWPVVRPFYGKGEDAAEIRRQNYFDAIGAADDLVTTLARGIAAGYVIHVNIGPGAILTADAATEPKTYANTVAQTQLREVCEIAAVVNVAAGAEDPRHYVAPE